MASAHELRHIRIVIGPSELRELADKMEKKFPALRIGDDTYLTTIAHGKDFRIDVCMDQEDPILKNRKR